ncbi:hypothetical protein BDW22DRAFT_1477306 [Trametopsis cervina]|nr:hypothetical protein BDW22DRAFT_1477306 [Trametopsis cervina]
MYSYSTRNECERTSSRHRSDFIQHRPSILFFGGKRATYHDYSQMPSGNQSWAQKSLQEKLHTTLALVNGFQKSTLPAAAHFRLRVAQRHIYTLAVPIKYLPSVGSTVDASSRTELHAPPDAVTVNALFDCASCVYFKVSEVVLLSRLRVMLSIQRADTARPDASCSVSPRVVAIRPILWTKSRPLHNATTARFDRAITVERKRTSLLRINLWISYHVQSPHISPGFPESVFNRHQTFLCTDRYWALGTTSELETTSRLPIILLIHLQKPPVLN